jgi:hypothetical protein
MLTRQSELIGNCVQGLDKVRALDKFHRVTIEFDRD